MPFRKVLAVLLLVCIPALTLVLEGTTWALELFGGVLFHTGKLPEYAFAPQLPGDNR